MTAAFGANYWLSALQHHESRPATRLLLCIVKAQYARLTQGVDGVSECATLREATGGQVNLLLTLLLRVSVYPLTTTSRHKGAG